MVNGQEGGIVLVTGNQGRKERYLAALQACGATCLTVRSLREAIARASEMSHSGVLIDMPLMIRVADSLKAGVEDLLSGLPSATLNIHASSGNIRILPRGSLACACTDIASFCAICKQFSPRLIHDRQRKPIHHNVLLSLTSEFSEPEQTVCIDISPGGCFLFHVKGGIAVGDTVWLKFPADVFEGGIMATVCWTRPWGVTREIPGIGLKFEGLPDGAWDRIAIEA